MGGGLLARTAAAPLGFTGEERLLLRDGRSVAVRPARPSDAPAVDAMFAAMSPDSLALRFGIARRGLVDGEADAMCEPPGPEGMGLVAVVDDGVERPVGLARYYRAPGAPEAEIALAISDDRQGLGIGTGLIERLLARARKDGIEALWAMVVPHNLRMLHCFQGLGGRIEEHRWRDEALVRIPTGFDDGLERRSAERFAGSVNASLRPLFQPAAIAVVGASRNPAKPGGAVLRALRDSGFPGPVWPVNPNAGEVAGVPAFPALRDLPGRPDLVVVAVAADAVPEVARQAAAAGARALLVLTAGFAEAGEAGAALQAQLLHVARVSGMRVVGPNCLGILTTDPAAPFEATFGAAMPPPGHVALATQSGGVAVAAAAACAERGLGVSSLVSLGNRADVSSNDLIAWWARDERTRVILLHLEGFGNPRRFARLAREVTRTTPIIALKAGRGPAGRRAAGSHTAALAAGEEPTQALLDLAGVVRVDSLEALLDAGQVLATQPPPAGPRVAIVANAGGAAILAADVLEASGLELPPLPCGPGGAAIPNPLDLGAGAPAARLTAAAEAVLAGGAVDAILMIDARLDGSDPEGTARAVAALSGRGVTVVGCGLGQVDAAPLAARGEVPWFDLPERAAAALAVAAKAGAAARVPDDPPQPPEMSDRTAGRRAILRANPGDWLDGPALSELLAAYAIHLPASQLVRSPEDAAAAQARMGVPVAVKVVAPGVTHKSDVGGVVLGCGTPDAAAAAYRQIGERLARARPDLAMEGALVQQQAPDGLDLIVGAVADPVFGPLVLAGLGGVEAELWRDRAVALAPPGPRAALELWRHLRASPLLTGWRGQPPVDLDALQDLVVRAGWLASDQPELAELDLNPVRALPDGGLVVLDARARRAGGGRPGAALPAPSEERGR